MTTVHTSFGEVVGAVRGGTTCFLGIPYAAPPVGELRFAAPQPPVAWHEPRPCLQYPKLPVQSDLTGGASAAILMSLPKIIGKVIGHKLTPSFLGPPQNKEGLREDLSEDCLFLNVWTPACDDHKRPVMVYIPGGALAAGGVYDSLDVEYPPVPEHNMMNGQPLCERGDAVVVVVSYRVGHLGFAPLGDCNWGFLDQIQALRFVQAEVARFGGDPDNVTLFGESAGGISVLAHLSSPLSKGLFHKAIAQSGGGPAVSRATAAPTLPVFAKDLGVHAAKLSVETLREVPVKKFPHATDAMKKAMMKGGLTDGTLCPPACQAIYGTEFLPTDFYSAMLAGSAAGVPVMFGHTKTETMAFKNFGLVPPTDKAKYIQYALPTLLGNTGFETKDTPAARKAIAAALDTVYEAYAELCHDRHETDILGYLLDTDMQHKSALFRMQHGLAKTGSKVFAFRFDVESVGGLGACHGVDIPYVFGVNRHMPPGFAPQDDAAVETSGRVMDAWLAFARTGCPATPEFAWPEAGPEFQTALLKDGGFAVAPFAAERSIWAAFDATVAKALGPEALGASEFFRQHIAEGHTDATEEAKDAKEEVEAKEEAKEEIKEAHKEAEEAK